MVIAPACQAGDRGFNPRRSRIFFVQPCGQFSHRVSHLCAARRNTLFFYIRAVAQGLARLVRDQEVGSSNLPSPKKALTSKDVSAFFINGVPQGFPKENPKSRLSEAKVETSPINKALCCNELFEKHPFGGAFFRCSSKAGNPDR